jgi:predicted DNA binding CopG/RHH family protein
MKAKIKATPKFKSEAEERAFWERPNSTDHLDLSKMRRVSFSNLKPTTQSISLRLPLSMLERIKVEANARDVPYQSLIKIWLDEKLSA